MKIVRIIGGLANQMFRYVFFCSLAEEHKNIKVDVSSFKNYFRPLELENVFRIVLPKANEKDLKGIPNFGSRNIFKRCLNKLFPAKDVYIERFQSYKSNIITEGKYKYYYGYWNSEKYFQAIEKKIRNDFIFKSPLDSRNKQIIDEMKNENSVSIHLRRGDYIKDPNASKLFADISSGNYYNNAISYFTENTKAPCFYFFSNDTNWVKSEFKYIQNKKIIDWNTDQNSYKDMQLMSNCKHNIIANSGFSWWSAWLNKNKNKIIIAPRKWFNTYEANDIVPENWIKL